MAEAPRTRIRWVLIVWMFVLSAVAYLDRVNISIAGKSLMQDFGLTNVQLGWVFSSFVVGYALFQAPGGRLADRLGPRWVLTAGVVWWGVFTSLTASIPRGIGSALALFLLVRFLLGAGEAVVYPASNRVVANWIPTSERGIANGLIFAGVGVGAGITPPLITSILVHYGWRWCFWISALIGFVVGAIWYVLARDTPGQHPRVSPAELEHIRAGLSKSVEQATTSVPWRAIFTSKEVLAITFSYFTYGYAAYIFFTWFFIYLTSVRGLNLKSGSFYTMLPFLAMAVCSPLGGIVCDVLTRRGGKRLGRCGVAGFGVALAAIFLALGARVESARLASVVLAGGVGALYLAQSSYWSVSADIAGPSAGLVSGLMNMGGQAGGALTATLTPILADHFGWAAPFLVAAGLCAAGAVAWAMVNPERELALEPMTVKPAAKPPGISSAPP